MNLKSYFYKDFDGMHYPDARMGSAYTYGMDFTNYLDCQEGFLKSIAWSLEEGLVRYEEGFKQGEPFTPVIKIGTPCPGSFTITCTMTYDAGGMEQEVAVPLVIKVY